MSNRTVFLAVVLGLSLTACAGAPAAPSGPSCATAKLAPEPLTDGWWQQGDAACPAGATLKIIEEKRSTVRMCLLRGTQHGPFQAMADDALLSAGWYLHGAKHGRWRRYDGTATARRIATWYFKACLIHWGWTTLGGVCLNRGCIPSKTLLSLVETNGGRGRSIHRCVQNRFADLGQ